MLSDFYMTAAYKFQWHESLLAVNIRSTSVFKNIPEFKFYLSNSD